jgi:hypothetical protein
MRKDEQSVKSTRVRRKNIEKKTNARLQKTEQLCIVFSLNLFRRLSLDLRI